MKYCSAMFSKDHPTQPNKILLQLRVNIRINPLHSYWLLRHSRSLCNGVYCFKENNYWISPSNYVCVYAGSIYATHHFILVKVMQILVIG